MKRDGPSERPPGRLDSVASGITGRPLRSFTPYPLDELLGGLHTSPAASPTTLNPRRTSLALALAHAAAKRGVGGLPDVVQAQRFCEILLQAPAWNTVPELIGVAKQISPKVQGLRQEIIFSGARTASEAHHIYAPHTLIPDLMQSLERVISTRDLRFDTTKLTATIGFFCVHLHPFCDGNGRWSRLVAAAIGIQRGCPLRAMINVVFQNSSRRELAVTVWPESRSLGLGNYLDLSDKFEVAVLETMQAQNLPNNVEAFNGAIVGAARHSSISRAILTKIYTHGEVKKADLKATLGLSTRAFNGFLDRAVSSAGGLVTCESLTISVNALHLAIDSIISSAKTTIFEGKQIDAICSS